MYDMVLLMTVVVCEVTGHSIDMMERSSRREYSVMITVFKLPEENNYVFEKSQGIQLT